MITVQVLDEDDDMKTESDDDGMNLSIVANISLRRLRKCDRRDSKEITLA